MRRNTAFVYAGLAGVVALLGGLALDSYLHARDPSLAHREGVFTLTNPGHLMLGIGIALVVVGVVGAAYTTLPYGVWGRLGPVDDAVRRVHRRARALGGDRGGRSADRGPAGGGGEARHGHQGGRRQ